MNKKAVEAENYVCTLVHYLYVRLPESSFPASRNSRKALITSWVEYHKCALGNWELVFWSKNLLFLSSEKNMCILLCSDVFDTLSSDGSQSGNLTIKSVLWSCNKLYPQLISMPSHRSIDHRIHSPESRGRIKLPIMPRKSNKLQSNISHLW